MFEIIIPVTEVSCLADNFFVASTSLIASIINLVIFCCGMFAFVFVFVFLSAR